MNKRKIIDGLMYSSQTEMAEILGLERHTIAEYKKRYNLPTIKEDKFVFYCTPIFVSLYMAKKVHSKRVAGIEDAGVLVAISHLPHEKNIANTSEMLQKGLNMSETKALLSIGRAIEWIRRNLKPEHHINI